MTDLDVAQKNSLLHVLLEWTAVNDTEGFSFLSSVTGPDVSTRRLRRLRDVALSSSRRDHFQKQIDSQDVFWNQFHSSRKKRSLPELVNTWYAEKDHRGDDVMMADLYEEISYGTQTHHHVCETCRKRRATMLKEFREFQSQRTTGDESFRKMFEQKYPDVCNDGCFQCARCAETGEITEHIPRFENTGMTMYVRQMNRLLCLDSAEYQERCNSLFNPGKLLPLFTPAKLYPCVPADGYDFTIPVHVLQVAVHCNSPRLDIRNGAEFDSPNKLMSTSINCISYLRVQNASEESVLSLDKGHMCVNTSSPAILDSEAPFNMPLYFSEIELDVLRRGIVFRHPSAAYMLFYGNGGNGTDRAQSTFQRIQEQSYSYAVGDTWTYNRGFGGPHVASALNLPLYSSDFCFQFLRVASCASGNGPALSPSTMHALFSQHYPHKAVDEIRAVMEHFLHSAALVTMCKMDDHMTKPGYDNLFFPEMPFGELRDEWMDHHRHLVTGDSTERMHFMRVYNQIEEEPMNLLKFDRWTNPDTTVLCNHKSGIQHAFGNLWPSAFGSRTVCALLEIQSYDITTASVHGDRYSSSNAGKEQRNYAKMREFCTHFIKAHILKAESTTFLDFVLWQISNHSMGEKSQDQVNCDSAYFVPSIDRLARDTTYFDVCCKELRSRWLSNSQRYHAQHFKDLLVQIEKDRTPWLYGIGAALFAVLRACYLCNFDNFYTYYELLMTLRDVRKLVVTADFQLACYLCASYSKSPSMDFVYRLISLFSLATNSPEEKGFFNKSCFDGIFRPHTLHVQVLGVAFCFMQWPYAEVQKYAHNLNFLVREILVHDGSASTALCKFFESLLFIAVCLNNETQNHHFGALGTRMQNYQQSAELCLASWLGRDTNTARESGRAHLSGLVCVHMRMHFARTNNNKNDGQRRRLTPFKQYLLGTCACSTCFPYINTQEQFEVTNQGIYMMMHHINVNFREIIIRDKVFMTKNMLDDFKSAGQAIDEKVSQRRSDMWLHRCDHSLQVIHYRCQECACRIKNLLQERFQTRDPRTFENIECDLMGEFLRYAHYVHWFALAVEDLYDFSVRSMCPEYLQAVAIFSAFFISGEAGKFNEECNLHELYNTLTVLHPVTCKVQFSFVNTHGDLCHFLETYDTFRSHLIECNSRVKHVFRTFARDMLDAEINYECTETLTRAEMFRVLVNCQLGRWSLAA